MPFSAATTLIMEANYKWIEQHLCDDTSALRLKYGKTHPFDILQIECRRRFGAKLADTLHENPRFLFPTPLSGEQATSSALARFHASLINSGDNVADFTAGLGIDAMAMAAVASRVTAVERDPLVAEALKVNTSTADNITVVCDDCRDFAEVCADAGTTYDCIFIDPARREADGSRAYALDRCEPSVTEMLPTLARLTPKLIIKASPMLDISHTLSLLPHVSRIIALGTTTECKELDIVCLFDVSTEEAEVSAVTVTPTSTEIFSFSRRDEAAATVEYGLPKVGDTVYDPYPAVMKSGAMKLTGQRFGLKKLAPNTHLWFSEQKVEDFPGHAFRVTEVLPYASRNIKRYASAHPRVSVSARNFDMTSETLRKRLGVSDGPDRLFGVTAADGNRYLITATPAEA